MHPFEAELAQSWPAERWRNVSVIIACSGGADSTALVRGLAELRGQGAGQLAVAHLNHQLRGGESDRDQQFVEALCKEINLPCFVETIVVEGDGDGIEAAARDARYAFLQRTAEASGARYVVTGHTANDQAETILHHILRGTSVTGLAGMPRSRPLSPAVTLLRPMLDISRQEVLDYLAALNQPYREDASNADTVFTRNRIRHELMPLLAEKYHPNVVDNLLRLGRNAKDAVDVIDSLATALMDECHRVDPDGASVVDCRRLANEPPHLVRELMVAIWKQRGWPRQSMTFDHWEQLRMMACNQSDARAAATLPGKIQAKHERDRLILRPA